MSEHVIEPCSGGNGVWIPLIEYSVKTGISLSTIRRKIKSNSIPFRLEKGKYLILLGESDDTAPVQSMRPRAELPTTSKVIERFSPKPQPVVEQPKTQEPIEMVSDAYEFAIREKDERIQLLEKRNNELEERLLELKLLVQCLEEKYDVRY